MWGYRLNCIYNYAERRIAVDRAKIFKSGNSQAVRLPKQFRLEGSEVYVKRVGRGLLLMPTDEPWASQVGSLGKFSDDFLEERSQPPLESREML